MGKKKLLRRARKLYFGDLMVAASPNGRQYTIRFDDPLKVVDVSQDVDDRTVYVEVERP